jgi:hypothetical protein
MTVIGRDSKDWNLAVEYLKVLESSGRKELEQWEIELRGWDPSRASETHPSPTAIAKLRAWAREP